MTQPGRALGSGLLIFWPEIVRKSGQRCQMKWKLFHKISGDPNYSWPNYWGQNLVYKQTWSVSNLIKTISQSRNVRLILSFILGPSGHPKLYLKRFFYFKKNVWQRSKNNPTRECDPAGSFCCLPLPHTTLFGLFWYTTLFDRRNWVKNRGLTVSAKVI